MEQALSLAHTILCQREKADNLPPRVYVEEFLTKEHTQTLRPFREVNSPTALENQARGSMEGGHCEELPTCYIEEVPYEELVSQGAITEGEH
jgi:hypothetical protein